MANFEVYLANEKLQKNIKLTMGNTFQTQYRVMYHDADSTGHLSIPALGNYVLDTAGLHATALGISMQQLAAQGMTWVMSGLRFRIHRLPEINSAIDLCTQISAYTRLSSQRDFYVSCGGNPVADISTEWLIINTKTRRPVFLTDVFPAIEGLVGGNPALQKYAHLRTSPDAARAGITKKTVEYSDIDINSHLYSIRYLSMALDTICQSPAQGRRISGINANFISEIFHGQDIEIATELISADGIPADGKPNETPSAETYNIEMRVDGKAMFRATVDTEAVRG